MSWRVCTIFKNVPNFDHLDLRSSGQLLFLFYLYLIVLKRANCLFSKVINLQIRNKKKNNINSSISYFLRFFLIKEVKKSGENCPNIITIDTNIKYT